MLAVCVDLGLSDRPTARPRLPHSRVRRKSYKQRSAMPAERLGEFFMVLRTGEPAT
ncbi:hypothetical protein BP1026B_II0426 [Burkholderia pseudomallei 1026b]|uniref:Uncharacterized protein n=1 Tax=Burkholderia pseudomallei (strain 1026b) TaxID=884204 RepID=A0A0H3HWV2_BURP2|nr:hypothetical protein BP1026B_II0426 [Burkholderia pseudomallei 1026b]EIF62419.1 hypothetical protein BP1026A_2112 [Burkholderia pseudomallei 1026a]